ncbi:MAG: branched-chain amino acid ABC transporter permease [Gemmatimonadales bacterium]|nr:branched-chain amino acid ABC transporter permease [Gemmatimonadales bacterium]
MASVTSRVEFRPIDLGLYLTWAIIAVLFLVMPLFFRSGFAISLLSQMGIMIVFALSYNMIFGQGGMLSFGHAVYSGLGAFFAIHALNWIGDGRLALPVVLIPLVGGIFGAICGVVFGYVTTKKAGVPFAMITLGIGEMVHAAALMFPDFFGGEAGISADRVVGKPFLGFNLGPSIQVYYLIAVWCFLSMIAMYAFSQTPLGRISNAVRDNPERAEFIGYNTQRVRFFILVASSFFAGISGGLAAINFEIINAEQVSAIPSGAVLVATFIGGAMFFFGPVIGSIIFILFAIALSEYTPAWQFYLGIFFVLMVMYAPGGVTSILLLNLRVAKEGLFKALRMPYLKLIAGSIVLLAGVVMLVEMAYGLTLSLGLGSMVRLFGIEFDAATPMPWIIVTFLLVVGGWLFMRVRRQFMLAWNEVNQQIENRLQRAGGSR